MALEFRLYPAAEGCVRAMHLNESQANQVRKCVRMYAMPDTFSEGLHWLAYRIFNAIKSVFFRSGSDWQITEKMLHEHLLVLIKKESPLPAYNTCMNRLNWEREFSKGTGYVLTPFRRQAFFSRADRLLGTCLLLQEKKPELNEFNTMYNDHMDFKRCVSDEIGAHWALAFGH